MYYYCCRRSSGVPRISMLLPPDASCALLPARQCTCRRDLLRESAVTVCHAPRQFFAGIYSIVWCMYCDWYWWQCVYYLILIVYEISVWDLCCSNPNRTPWVDRADDRPHDRPDEIWMIHLNPYELTNCWWLCMNWSKIRSWLFQLLSVRSLAPRYLRLLMNEEMS
jgi:hypothetical protein